MGEAPTSLSSVIPVYNGGAALLPCLAGILYSPLLPHKVIVDADGDTSALSGLQKRLASGALSYFKGDRRQRSLPEPDTQERK